MTDQPGDFDTPPEAEDDCEECGHATLYFVCTDRGSRYGPTPTPPEYESYCLCQQGRGEEGCKCDYEY